MVERANDRIHLGSLRTPFGTVGKFIYFLQDSREVRNIHKNSEGYL